MQSSFPTEVCRDYSYSYFSKTYSNSSLNVFISIELLEERINFIHIEPDLLVVVSNFAHKWLSTHLVTSIPGFRFSSTRFPPLGNRQDVTPIYQLIWPNKCWVWGSRVREGSLRQKLTSPNDIKDNKGSRAKISYERASRAALQKHDTKICIPKHPWYDMY